jgi:hypothetical protein
MTVMNFIFSDIVIMGYFKRRGGRFHRARNTFLPALCRNTKSILLDNLLLDRNSLFHHTTITCVLCRCTRTGMWWSSWLGGLRGLGSRRSRSQWTPRAWAAVKPTSRTGRFFVSLAALTCQILTWHYQARFSWSCASQDAADSDVFSSLRRSFGCSAGSFCRPT